MRGPMASKVMNQLMLATEWGDLDYLVSASLSIHQYNLNFV